VPTIVQFVGGESLTLEDDFDRVNKQGQHDAGLFNRLVGDDPVRVTIYRSNVPISRSTLARALGWRRATRPEQYRL
jgi:hypothetical protein